MAENFIGVLRRDDARTNRRIVRLAAAAGLLALLASLLLDLRLTGRLVGTGLGVTLLALIGGILLGGAWGWLKHYRLYDHSLRRNWNRWMRYSVACVSVAEIHRKVRGKESGPSTTALAAGWGFLLFVSLVTLFMTFVDGGLSLSQMPFFLLYGALLGIPLGEAILRKTWIDMFLQSIDDMVRKGQVDVWGVY